jgi:GntR family transcriptional regulator
MRLDPADPRPLYQVVADDLRRAITSGTYQPGDKLPSGRDLAREYAIAPMTVTSALSILRDEGLVAPRQGRGVYVLSPGSTPRVTGPDSERLARLETEVDVLSRRVRALEEKVSTPSRGAARGDRAGMPGRDRRRT